MNKETQEAREALEKVKQNFEITFSKFSSDNARAVLGLCGAPLKAAQKELAAIGDPVPSNLQQWLERFATMSGYLSVADSLISIIEKEEQ